MAVANIECRLAQAQMSLFLSGDPLGEDVLGELEDHIAECADCRKLLAAKRAEILSHQGPSPASTAPRAPSRWNPIRASQTEVDTAVVETRPRPPMGKPLVYSIGLAAVLVAMSFFSDPTRLFGDRLADAKTPASTTPKNSAAPTTELVATRETAEATNPESTPQPEVEASKLALQAVSGEGTYPLDEIDQPPPTPDEERAAAAFAIEMMREGAQEATPAAETVPTKAVEPPPAPEVKPKPAEKATVRRPARRVRAQAPRRPTIRRAPVRRPAAKGGGIRVYDSQGNLIRP